ncbi:MAG: hypothetical protein WBP55_04395 [Solirubrobacterales bacterium]
MESSGSKVPGGSAAWASWVAFAGIIMMLTGVFGVIAGLSAAFEDNYFVRGTSGGDVYLLSVQAVGVIWMVLGVIKVWAGYALIQGREWARFLTIAICFVHAIVDMTTLTTQPFLSLIFIAFNVTIIYAVTVRWEVAKTGMGD